MLSKNKQSFYTIKHVTLDPYLKEIKRIRKSTSAHKSSCRKHNTLSQPAIKPNFIDRDKLSTQKNNNQHTTIIHHFRQRSYILKDQIEKNFFSKPIREVEQTPKLISRNKSNQIQKNQYSQYAKNINSLLDKHKQHRKNKFYIQKQIDNKSIKSTRSIINTSRSKTPTKIPHVRIKSQIQFIKVANTQKARILPKEKKRNFREGKYSSRPFHRNFNIQISQQQNQLEDIQRYIPKKIKEIDLSLEKSNEKYNKQNSYREKKSNQDIEIFISTIKNPSLDKNYNVPTTNSYKQKDVNQSNKALFAYDFQFQEEQPTEQKQSGGEQIQYTSIIMENNPTFGLRLAIDKIIKQQSSDQF